MTVNQYGLSRTIPADVKRAIRQKCGFGCIFCGNWLYEYEHIDPEYVDAKVHDPEKMCLLCPDHHNKVTLGRLSKDQVAEQYTHPIALSNGYANDYLDFQSKIHIILGRIFFHEPSSIIRVGEIDLLSLTTDLESKRMLLNAKFYDSSGNLILEIIENEVFAYSHSWDIQQVGSRTIIRKKMGSIALQFNLITPDIIEIERIHMVYGPAEISANADTGAIFIKSSSGVVMDLPNAQIITQGLSINRNNFTFNKALFMSAPEGMPMNKMDYRAYIDTGAIHSLPTPT